MKYSKHPLNYAAELTKYNGNPQLQSNKEAESSVKQLQKFPSESSCPSEMELLIAMRLWYWDMHLKLP